MADRRIEKDMPLKTTVMGFDKKEVMDFVEEIQKENQKLKHIVVSLGTENDQLKAQVGDLLAKNEELQKLITYSSEAYAEESSDGFIDVSSNSTPVEPQPPVTYEDISLEHYQSSEPVVKETVQSAVAKTRKKPGVTVIRSKKSKK